MRRRSSQFLAQLLPQLVVEIGKRLVEQHQIGILDDGAGERGALLLTAGQVERRAVEIGRELQEFRRLAHFAVDGGAVGALDRIGEAMFS